MNTKQKVFSFIVSLTILTMMLICPDKCAEGIKQGMTYAAEIIIPSLFPYMVLSSFILRSGADNIVGIIARPLTKLLYLPECAGSAVILSMTGGFPVGAKCVSVLYNDKRLSDEEAGRMMLFCVCPGPAFLITALGYIMLGSIESGFIVYISQIISSLIIGIILGCFSRFKNRNAFNNTVRYSNNRQYSVISCLIESARDGADSIIIMTALILFFTMVLGVVSRMILYFTAKTNIDPDIVSAVVSSFAEVTGGCQAVKNAGLPLWYFSACVGFGGICVHFQIFGILSDIPVRRADYLLFRCLNAFLSFAVTWLICQFYEPSVYTVLRIGEDTACLSTNNITGSIALLIMSVIFVLSAHSAKRCPVPSKVRSRYK